MNQQHHNHAHHKQHDCCHNEPEQHSHHGHSTGTSRQMATHATLHCLTGCAIGEFVGLAIGVSLGLNPWVTMTLATLLGFASGYTLGLWPLVKAGSGWMQAFRIIWLGETISIAVMELVMNFTDYHVGGVQAASMFTAKFWLGYLAALPAGFIAAWPVNYWLLKRNIKKECH
jgi:cation transport ATPase